MKTKINKENNLRLLRLLHDDLPQKWVAYKLGVSQVAYCKMERGELIPSDEIIQKLSELFEIDIRVILHIPRNELKTRMLNQPIAIEYKLIDNLEMEFNILKRKLEVVKYSREKNNISIQK